jgi:hypothetical protein
MLIIYTHVYTGARAHARAHTHTCAHTSERLQRRTYICRSEWLRRAVRAATPGGHPRRTQTVRAAAVSGACRLHAHAQQQIPPGCVVGGAGRCELYTWPEFPVKTGGRFIPELAKGTPRV